MQRTAFEDRARANENRLRELLLGGLAGDDRARADGRRGQEACREEHGQKLRAHPDLSRVPRSGGQGQRTAAGDARQRGLATAFESGNPAVMDELAFAGRPVALRPRLSAGLPLSAREC